MSLLSRDFLVQPCPYLEKFVVLEKKTFSFPLVSAAKARYLWDHGSRNRDSIRSGINLHEPIYGEKGKTDPSLWGGYKFDLIVRNFSSSFSKA